VPFLSGTKVSDAEECAEIAGVGSCQHALMTTRLASTFLVDGFVYGEGPRWHDRRLWFVDTQGDAILTVDEHGTLEHAVATHHPAGLGWFPDGTLVFSTMHSAQIKTIAADGTMSVLVDLNDRAWSTNDLVVGPDGRIYADLYQKTEGGYPIGEVVLVTPDGVTRSVASGLATPNGIAISADRSTLVVSETFSGKLLAFTIEADGTLSGQRVFADLGPERRPDGVCLDAEGAAWVGSAYTGEFLRVRDGGEITHVIACPGDMAIATAMGGDDRRTLFLVIAEMAPEDMGTPNSKGRIEHVRVDVPGAGWP
jgi:sugar lactone lactonase YvrE